MRGARCRASPGGQAESSTRPLRRRAARMARPARVRMRSRKPCVLARRRLFGWKVRLLTCTSLHSRLQEVPEPGTMAVDRAFAGLRARRYWLLSSLLTVRRCQDQGQTSASSTACGQPLWKCCPPEQPLLLPPAGPVVVVHNQARCGPEPGRGGRRRGHPSRVSGCPHPNFGAVFVPGLWVADRGTALREAEQTAGASPQVSERSVDPGVSRRSCSRYGT